MQLLAPSAGFVALMASGLMAGLFYSYSVSVMWGLDRADPRHAIDAMKGINVAILNPWFLPIFMAVPLLAGLAAALYWLGGAPLPALFFGGAAIVYLVGTFGVTVGANVPMNEALDRIATLPDAATALRIWSEHSSRWTAFNHIRSLAAAATLALAGLGLLVA